MKKTTMDKRKLKKWAIKSVRWSIGIIVLYIVFQCINFDQLKSSVAKSSPWLILIGLAQAPILIILAAFRWRFLLSQYYGSSLTAGYVLKHYWTGLALGFFTPGSLGHDAYRIIVPGLHFRNYNRSTAVVLVEKLISLITCMTIIVILYPIVPITLTPTTDRIFSLAYILLAGATLLTIGIVVVLRNKSLSLFLDKLERYFLRILEKIVSRIGVGKKLKTSGFTIRSILEPLANPWIIIVFLFSFGIQFISSIKSQIFFHALGYDLPFIVNLFVVPALYFIFFLPISFGSLGIREGMYILLYGLFGVPVEIALIVSFLNLFGMLLNNSIGGLIILFTKFDDRYNKLLDTTA